MPPPPAQPPCAPPAPAAQALGLAPRTCALACYLAELAQLEYGLLRHRPSLLAAAAARLAGLYTADLGAARWAALRTLPACHGPRAGLPARACACACGCGLLLGLGPASPMPHLVNARPPLVSPQRRPARRDTLPNARPAARDAAPAGAAALGPLSVCHRLHLALPGRWVASLPPCLPAAPALLLCCAVLCRRTAPSAPIPSHTRCSLPPPIPVSTPQCATSTGATSGSRWLPPPPTSACRPRCWRPPTRPAATPQPSRYIQRPSRPTALVRGPVFVASQQHASLSCHFPSESQQLIHPPFFRPAAPRCPWEGCDTPSPSRYRPRGRALFCKAGAGCGVRCITRVAGQAGGLGLKRRRLAPVVRLRKLLRRPAAGAADRRARGRAHMPPQEPSRPHIVFLQPARVHQALAKLALATRLCLAALHSRAPVARQQLARAWVAPPRTAHAAPAARNGAAHLTAAAAAAAADSMASGEGKRALEGGAEGGPSKKAAPAKVNPKRVRELKKGKAEGSGPVIYWSVSSVGCSAARPRLTVPPPRLRSAAAAAAASSLSLPHTSAWTPPAPNNQHPPTNRHMPGCLGTSACETTGRCCTRRRRRRRAACPWPWPSTW